MYAATMLRLLRIRRQYVYPMIRDSISFEYISLYISTLQNVLFRERQCKYK